MVMMPNVDTCGLMSDVRALVVERVPPAPITMLVPVRNPWPAKAVYPVDCWFTNGTPVKAVVPSGVVFWSHPKTNPPTGSQQVTDPAFLTPPPLKPAPPAPPPVLVPPPPVVL